MKNRRIILKIENERFKTSIIQVVICYILVLQTTSQKCYVARAARGARIFVLIIVMWRLCCLNSLPRLLKDSIDFDSIFPLDGSFHFFEQLV